MFSDPHGKDKVVLREEFPVQRELLMAMNLKTTVSPLTDLQFNIHLPKFEAMALNSSFSLSLPSSLRRNHSLPLHICPPFIQSSAIRRRRSLPSSCLVSDGTSLSEFKFFIHFPLGVALLSLCSFSSRVTAICFSRWIYRSGFCIFNNEFWFSSFGLWMRSCFRRSPLWWCYLLVNKSWMQYI